jgi:hypothetical protein
MAIMNLPTSPDLKRFALRTLIGFIGLYLLVALSVAIISRSSKAEYHIYVNYAMSLVEDGDLNPLNQLDREAAWVVSTTFNYPSMHDHGIGVLWAPLFFVANQLKLEPFSVQRTFSLEVDGMATYILNVVLIILFVSVLLSWAKRASQNTKTGGIPLPALVSVIFGTGFFYYALIQWTGTEITLAFFSLLAVVHAYGIGPSFRLRDYFLLGATVAFGRLIKIHFPTYLLPVLYLYVHHHLGPYLAARKSASGSLRPLLPHLRNALGFLGGFGFLFLLLAANDSLKFGFFNFGQGYAQEFSLAHSASLSDTLTTYFGPIGFFTHTPVFLFTFLTFFFLLARFLRDRHEFDVLDKLGLFMYVSVLFKLVALQFTATPGAIEFGARNFVIDTAAQVLILRSLLIRLDTPLLRRTAYTVLAAAVTWTLINFLWYVEIDSWDPDQRLAHAFWSVGDFGTVWKNLYPYYYRAMPAIRHLPTAIATNWPWWPLILAGALVLGNLKQVTGVLQQKRVLGGVSLALLALYAIATGLNFRNNPLQAENLKKSGEYEQIVVGNGPHIFTYDNYATDLLPTLELDKFKNDRASFDRKLAFFKTLMQKAKAEIVYDGAGFGQIVEDGKLPRVGVSDDQELEKILDFDHPHRFRRF